MKRGNAGSNKKTGIAILVGILNKEIKNISQIKI